MKYKTIMWFRQDLRITDNPALNNACSKGEVIPIYIHDDHNNKEKNIGSASKWWLHHSLNSLNKSLDGRLITLSGDPIDLLPQIISKSGAQQINWNRNYEPWQINRDKILKSKIEKSGIKVLTFNGSLLWEPWTILNQSELPYKVFTPFYRKGCLNADSPRNPISQPHEMIFTNLKDFESLNCALACGATVFTKQASFKPSVSYVASS